MTIVGKVSLQITALYMFTVLLHPNLHNQQKRYRPHGIFSVKFELAIIVLGPNSHKRVRFRYKVDQSMERVNLPRDARQFSFISLLLRFFVRQCFKKSQATA